MHPGWLRCSSVEYGQYAPSSRLAIRAPGRSRCDAGFHRGLLERFQNRADDRFREVLRDALDGVRPLPEEG